MYPRASALAPALALGLALAAAAIAAETAPPSKAARVAVSQGPIKISAAHAELEQREVALYQGNVRLTNNELTLTGDRLELRQPVRGQFEAKLTGKPARLVHAATGELPEMAASAAQITYDTRQAYVDLTGGVALSRGADTLSSESLHYDVAARRISATGAGNGQVQITIQPGSLEPGLPPQEKKPKAEQNGASAPKPKRKGH